MLLTGGLSSESAFPGGVEYHRIAAQGEQRVYLDRLAASTRFTTSGGRSNGEINTLARAQVEVLYGLQTVEPVDEGATDATGRHQGETAQTVWQTLDIEG